MDSEVRVALTAFEDTCTWTVDPSDTNTSTRAHTYGSCSLVANTFDFTVMWVYVDPVVVLVIKVVGV